MLKRKLSFTLTDRGISPATRESCGRYRSSRLYCKFGSLPVASVSLNLVFSSFQLPFFSFQFDFSLLLIVKISMVSFRARRVSYDSDRNAFCEKTISVERT